jgi:hypothetical protein
VTARKPRPKPELPSAAGKHVSALAALMETDPEVVAEALRGLQARLAAQRENAAKAKGGGRPRRKEVSLAMKDLAAGETAPLFFFEPLDDTGRPLPEDDPRRRAFEDRKLLARKAAIAKHVAKGAKEKNTAEASRRAVGRLVAENISRRGVFGDMDQGPVPEPDDFNFDPHLDKLGPLDPPK